MKRIILLIVAILVTTVAFSQKIVREIRNTFTSYSSKVTKVVVPSNSLADLMLRDAVSKGWRISPFEFCTLEEYEELKNDSSYFFLMRVDGRFRNQLEPSIEYISLVRGGDEIKRASFSSHNIISLPLQAANDNSGVNLYLLPAFIDIIQNYIYKIQQNAPLAFSGSSSYAGSINEVKDKRLIFPMEYLNFSISEGEFKSLFFNKISVVSLEETEYAIVNSSKESIVPIVIKPKDERSGLYCYKMLIATDSHELLFFRRHKITTRSPAGFTREDIRKISLPFHF